MGHKAEDQKEKGHVWKCAKGFENIHQKNGIGKRNAEEDCCSSVMKKELCVANTWFYKADKRKITYSAGKSETKIDFVLVGEKYRKYRIYSNIS